MIVVISDSGGDNWASMMLSPMNQEWAVRHAKASLTNVSNCRWQDRWRCDCAEDVDDADNGENAGEDSNGDDGGDDTDVDSAGDGDVGDEYEHLDTPISIQPPYAATIVGRPHHVVLLYSAVQLLWIRRVLYDNCCRKLAWEDWSKLLTPPSSLQEELL